MCTSISNVTGKNHPGQPQAPGHDRQGVVEGVHRQGIPVSTVLPRRPKDHRGQENKGNNPSQQRKDLRKQRKSCHKKRTISHPNNAKI